MIEKIGKGPAKRLTIEITESFRIYDLKLANENIQKLRARGVMVCMDDFGAGEATLRYLRELEVDVVKIDGLYVRGAVNSPRDQILLRHITSLCADLKVLTVAEMIETTETAELVRNLGVDMGQGWLFGGPSEQPVMRAQDLGTSTARRAGARETWG
jgi:EAL domain-containing protein (putative c-di-GMP-specific phosphodiesterase class I)